MAAPSYAPPLTGVLRRSSSTRRTRRLLGPRSFQRTGTGRGPFFLCPYRSPPVLLAGALVRMEAFG